jgi:hypothetical protein
MAINKSSVTKQSMELLGTVGVGANSNATLTHNKGKMYDAYIIIPYDNAFANVFVNDTWSANGLTLFSYYSSSVTANAITIWNLNTSYGFTFSIYGVNN